MQRTPFTRADFVVFLIITLLIGAAGSALIYSYVHRDHRWFQIVSPANERAVEILAVNRLLRVYVRTDQGNLYLCGGRTWRDACEAVGEADIPVVKVPGRWSNCTALYPEPPPLAGDVMDALQVGQCFEGRTFSKLVILADGTMWQWLRTYSWVNGFALTTGVALSLALGALAGWGVIWLRRYLREDGKYHAAPPPIPAPRPGEKIH